MAELAQVDLTPLHHSAQFGKLECARLLLERGANMDAKSKVRWPRHTTFGVDSVLQRRAELKHRIASNISFKRRKEKRCWTSPWTTRCAHFCASAASGLPRKSN